MSESDSQKDREVAGEKRIKLKTATSYVRAIGTVVARTLRMREVQGSIP